MTDQAGRESTCRDCGKPLQGSDECRVSGLCLLCLNGPVPGRVLSWG